MVGPQFCPSLGNANMSQPNSPNVPSKCNKKLRLHIIVNKTDDRYFKILNQ